MSARWSGGGAEGEYKATGGAAAHFLLEVGGMAAAAVQQQKHAIAISEVIVFRILRKKCVQFWAKKGWQTTVGQLFIEEIELVWKNQVNNMHQY